MKIIILYLVILGISFPAQAQKTMPVTVTSVTTLTPSVPVFGKFEAAAQLSQHYQNPLNPDGPNPYDSDVIAVEAVFISPSGKSYPINAFYMIPYGRDTARSTWTQGPLDTPWHVRFSPNEAGEWQYSFRTTENSGLTASGLSAPYRFTCTATTNGAHGFLRVAQNKRYLEFSDGTSFFGIAEDVRSAFHPLPANLTPAQACGGIIPDCQGASPCYSFNTQPQQLSWIKNFRAQGGNLVRIWLEPYSYEFEWEQLGNFATDNRQQRAADFDKLLDYCAEQQMFIHLVTYNVLAFSTDSSITKDDNGWNHNPYRPLCDSVSGFFTNKQAIAKYKNRLRYIHSRWGYSPAIASYGLMNEPEFIENYWTSPAINDWFEQMALYLKNAAFPAHLVSVDYASATGGVNSSPAIDFTNAHFYTNDKYANYQRAYLASNHLHNYDKPYTQTEFGFADAYPNDVNEGLNDDVRQTIWSSALSGSFSTAFYYGAEGKYQNACWGGDAVRMFAPLSAFLRDEKFNSPAAVFRPIGSAYRAYKSLRAPAGLTSVIEDAPGFDTSGFAPLDNNLNPFKKRYLARDVEASNQRIEVFALRSPEKILGWVHDKDYYWYNLRHGAPPLKFNKSVGGIHSDTLVSAAVTALVDQTITIRGMDRKSRYRVEWYSTKYKYDIDGNPGTLEDGGRITDPALGGSSIEAAPRGRLVIKLPKLQPAQVSTPPFAPDYGFKITRLAPE